MGRTHGMSRRRALGVGLASAAVVPTLLSAGGHAWAASSRAPRQAPPGEPPMDVVWTTDFTNGWDGWEDTPWNDQPQGEVERPTVVASPLGQGQSGRFHLDGGQQRNESQPEAAQSIGEGDVLVVRFTDYLEEGFPVDTDDWQIVLQFKNDGEGSPPCEIKIGHGVYALDGNSGAWSHDIGPAITGEPVDIAVRIIFSADPAVAAMDAWHNGTQTLTGAKPEGAGTLYEGLGSYLKTGLYRDSAISEAGTRYLDSLTIGTPA
ncbi:heparin lyase I family protein [Amycolatopsis antarctica]|nr:heparin lyase I family protein [Amycolatopsis antarctica]